MCASTSVRDRHNNYCRYTLTSAIMLFKIVSLLPSQELLHSSLTMRGLLQMFSSHPRLVCNLHNTATCMLGKVSYAPVHRQMFPSNKSSICCLVGFGVVWSRLHANKDDRVWMKLPPPTSLAISPSMMSHLYMDITIPGVQYPH